MRFQRHCEIIKGEINLTPLVDVVFQLIIFFMLSSSFIMQPGIKIKLPKAETTDVIKEKEIFINITEEGTIYFKGKRVSLPQLEKVLKEEIKNKKDLILVVKADKDAKHGIVVNVMDKAKISGIERIAIATLPEF
ncbi:MAG: biopolymer transporter ExbD [bacterium]|nr:biopolymer transporter ExbD [bacterium]MDW8164829.1 biopolymer transporter ExbD [Candidatus Omnitrophota bacterium]